MSAQHNRAGIRAHAAKFNVDTAARKRLRVALKTLDEHAEAVRMALRETCDIEDSADLRVRVALEVLAYGEKGEFR